jgi:muramoyltetrapeptide carboxypeptidase
VKKHIYLYSPSSAVRDKAGFKRAIKRLTTLGYDVEVDKAALDIHQRFAGEDDVRLAAIHRATASGADIALISRGGYGLTRLLPRIDYPAVEKAISNGTQFVGLSDFTAFQMAVLAKTGAVTWAGPALNDFGDKEGVDDIMQACFEDLLSGQGEGSGWQLPKTAADVAGVENFTVENAMLWGGNLSLLTSLVGTPFFPLVKNGVLFIEDIGEHPYRIERMLTQLLQAGILDTQQAIIFGQFNGYQLAPHDKGYKLASVVAWLKTQVKAPVLTGLPFGHVPTKVLLPVGQKITLAVDKRDAFLLWGHQH